MRVTGISADEVERTVDRVSRELWGGNIRAEITDLGCGPRTGPRCSFVLRANSSKETGARRSASGRRTVAVCWHAHRDVLSYLLSQRPTARIKTALADYRGLSGFHRDFPGTYHASAGSMMNPRTFGSLCECETDARTTWGDISDPLTRGRAGGRGDCCLGRNP